MKNLLQSWANWLETHWVNPAYGGLVLGSISLFFFLAATNTLSGWLYVMSGMGLSLMGLSGYLARQGLQGLEVQRSPLEPVSVGDWLTLTLTVKNPTDRPRSLLQIYDRLPPELGIAPPHALAYLAPHSRYQWSYTHPTQQRGVYQWDGVTLRSGNPLGLCWFRRDWAAPGRAIVYPQVLPLSQCPLVDQIGAEQDRRSMSQRRNQSATEGVTRTLRPYRWGDPMRLIHWRTSARYGELRVRELEIWQGGLDLVIALDGQWSTPAGLAAFESAIVAAASLYFYARRRQVPVQLWSSATGLVQGDRPVLEVLAALQPHPPQQPLPPQPVLWITGDPGSLGALPEGSRWVLWPLGSSDRPLTSHPGLIIQGEDPLPQQLQRPLLPSL